MGLAKTDVEKTLYCFSCGQSGHAKNDCLSNHKKYRVVNHPKWNPVVPTKNSTKEVDTHLPRN